MGYPMKMRAAQMRVAAIAREPSLIIRLKKQKQICAIMPLFKTQTQRRNVTETETETETETVPSPDLASYAGAARSGLSRRGAVGGLMAALSSSRDIGTGFDAPGGELRGSRFHFRRYSDRAAAGGVLEHT